MSLWRMAVSGSGYGCEHMCAPVWTLEAELILKDPLDVKDLVTVWKLF